jgi:hypothetical protein
MAQRSWICLPAYVNAWYVNACNAGLLAGEENVSVRL